MSPMDQSAPETQTATRWMRGRVEVIDGTLIVVPASSPRHQRAVGTLWRVMDHALPQSVLEVVLGPFNVVFSDNTAVEPDLLVARRDDLEEPGLAKAPPLLLVEVLAPTTRRYDLMLKRVCYEAAGTPSYWVVDPDVPSLTAWELRDGRYVEVAEVTGDETFHAEIPYPVDITPSTLVRRERV